MSIRDEFQAWIDGDIPETSDQAEQPQVLPFAPRADFSQGARGGGFPSSPAEQFADLLRGTRF
ncbi:hypothetical protein [Agrococcus beijingensis]|uniref:hypothetical protein n=1 Tax=Agrococcus beijingensis TaxID=3068634 RepID=UPI00274118C9|nr:hypothetical protein [Agrococcus sp. REN33]